MRALLFVTCLGLMIFGIFSACNKNNNPAPPVTDTVRITKTDTVIAPAAPDPTVNLKQGLLLYLPFNGDIADSSGNNNQTYAVGNVLGYDAHGFANSAFNGDGVSSHVIVKNNGSIVFDTAFSVSFDFMLTGSARQMLIALVDTATGYGPTFFDNLSIPGLPNFDFWANDVSAGCEAQNQNPATDHTLLSDTTTLIPLLNTWYNIITVYHKGVGTTYVNGQFLHSKQTSGTGPLNCTQNSIVIGGWWNGDLIPLHGKMDEVRIYNRVLTPHEIAALSQHYQVTSEKVQPSAVRGR